MNSYARNSEIVESTIKDYKRKILKYYDDSTISLFNSARGS